jgi:hypothetical protein
MPDDLERACAQVGRFLYYFAQLENQIDEALAKLFRLDANSANMITGSVAFYKRFNLVRTATLAQISDPKEQERVDKILNEVRKHNDGRQVVAHSRFEPLDNGVKFTRVVAREGTVKIPPETWCEEDFENKYAAMQKLVQQLKEVMAQVKPAAGYVLQVGGGDYAAVFGQVTPMGSPRVLLDDKE